ncbi:MAG: hypothetical protein WEB06_09075 [Actinomycetota bacterium]
MRARRLVWGLLAVGAYLVIAIGLAGNGPVLPLYDSGPLPIEPYRWVKPPPEFATGNIPPEGTKQEAAMTDIGTVAAQVITPEGQAVIALREGSFTPRLGEIAVLVEIRPLDPATFGEPPEGVRYDGNAYRITATYAKEGAPAALANPGTVILRSALGGTRLLRHQEGEGWIEISAQPVAASLQVFGETNALGVFVAAQTIHAKPFPWVWVSAGASVVAIGAGWFAAGRIRERKLSRAPRRDRRQAARAKGGPAPDPRPAPKRRKRR